jgi:hypothetical protein
MTMAVDLVALALARAELRRQRPKQPKQPWVAFVAETDPDAEVSGPTFTLSFRRAADVRRDDDHDPAEGSE